MGVVVAAVLVLTIFWYLHRYVRNLRRNRLLDKIPGPAQSIVSASLITVRNEDVLPVLDKLHKKYGEIYRIWGGSQPMVHISNPAYVQTILGSSKHIRKGSEYRFLLPWLGNGLLSNDGRRWATHRRLITPTFHFIILESFFEIYNECAQILVGKLQQQSKEGDFFDVYPFVTRCALDIICETAMGFRIHAQENEVNEFGIATLKASELVTKRQFTFWLKPDIIFFNTSYGREFNKSIDVIHNFTEAIINERQKSRCQKTNATSNKQDDGSGTKKRQAFLDLLLDSAENSSTPLTDEEMREEVETFMFAGHDTTTSSICWTLLMLGNSPEVQNAVHDELEVIFEGTDRPVTTQDIGEMKLLDRVIRETLRMRPSVTLISRILDHDVQLGKYVIPAETNVCININNLHRQAHSFPEPNKFNPDRFLPDEASKRHPYAYIPFSAGQRNCLGQKFAILEDKVVLSTILRKFNVKALHTVEQCPPIQLIVSKPKNGVYICLTPKEISKRAP